MSFEYSLMSRKSPSLTGTKSPSSVKTMLLNGDGMLRNWLREIDSELEQYHVIFTKHKMTYDLLSLLTDADLATTIEPEIPLLGHRLLLRHNVERLRRANGLKSTQMLSRQSSFEYQPSPIASTSARSQSHRYIAKSYDRLEHPSRLRRCAAAPPIPSVTVSNRLLASSSQQRPHATFPVR